jgi:hypothetical protein
MSLAGLLLLLISPLAHAQPTTAPQPLPRVFLMTIGPGDEVYELFGHNAIVISDPASGFEAAYNWGVFDFNQPNFVGRFILGRMLYRLQAVDVGASIASYRRDRRETRLTELNLSPAQKRRLLQLCIDNDTDARRDYRYDYYKDNCSTRVRDMLNQAIGNQLAEQLKPLPALTPDGKPATFRFHTDRLTRQAPWLYVALHYVLGAEVDQSLSRWDEAFLPLELERHLGEVSIVWEDGSTHPLLGRSITVAEATGRAPEPTAPPSWGVYFLLAGLGYAFVLVAAGWRTRSSHPKGSPRTARTVGLLTLPWALLCSLLGSISTFGMLFTDHTVARNNVNWLQVSPLSLPILLIAVLLLFGRRPRWSMWAAAVPVGLSAVGLLLEAVNHQPNAAILMFAVPAHLGVLVAVWLISTERAGE